MSELKSSSPQNAPPHCSPFLCLCFAGQGKSYILQCPLHLTDVRLCVSVPQWGMEETCYLLKLVIGPWEFHRLLWQIANIFHNKRLIDIYIYTFSAKFWSGLVGRKTPSMTAVLKGRQGDFSAGSRHSAGVTGSNPCLSAGFLPPPET